MIKINNAIAFLIIALWMTISTSCDDNDNWKPGAKPASDNPGVYFDQNNPKVFELEANDQMELVQDYFTISLGRDKTKTGSALRVPVRVLYADGNLSVSQNVEFEAGSAHTELKIHMKEYNFGTLYNFSVEIDENFADPYKNFEGEIEGGSSRVDAKVEVLSLVATTIFTPTDYTGAKQPGFIPFEQKIYDNFDGTYSIRNFLLNGAGRNLTFALDEENNIKPVITSGYHDEAGKRWFFYSANSSASANRIPCYVPGNNVNDYITYIYFYTAEEEAVFQAFSLNLAAKTGRMMGYSRYSVSSSGRIAFNISWK